jgi:hypothetical protein
MHALMLAKMSSAAVTAPEVDERTLAPVVARQNGAILIVSTFHAVLLTTEARSPFLRPAAGSFSRGPDRRKLTEATNSDALTSEAPS